MDTTTLMQDIPPDQSLIAYPSQFPIKVMGANVDGFVHAVVEVARRFDPGFDASTIELRPSKGEKYIGVTRLGIYGKEYVFRIEQAVLKTLEQFGVTGHRVAGAPGIYVKLADPFGHAALIGPRPDPFEGLGKIAALGIKVSRHCTYHGV